MEYITEFSTGYNKGYFKALSDFMEFLDYYEEPLSQHKVISKSHIRAVKEMLLAAIKDKETFMRYGGHVAFARRSDGTFFIKKEV